MNERHADVFLGEETRPPWRRLVDFVFGYDYFISYAWSDGRVYATSLAAALREAGFECFLDSDQFRLGDHWRKVGSWTLRRTSNLILVASPNAVRSEPVLYELETFRRHRNNVIALNFDGTLDRPDNDPRLQRYLPPDVIRQPEPLHRLEAGPSYEVLRRLREDFKGLRQTQWRTRLLVAAVLLFAAILLFAGWLWREERRQSMTGLAQRLAAAAIAGTRRAEHERAALLARQAYLFNRRHRGSAIARADEALRAVLGSPTFNVRLVPNFTAIGPPGTVNIRGVVHSAKTDALVIATVDKVGIARLQDPGLAVRRLVDEDLAYPALAMTADGTLLAVAGSERGVLLYDLTIAEPKPTVLPIANGTATCVAFARGTRVLVAGTREGSVHAWDLAAGAQERRIGQHGPEQEIHAIAIDASARWIATAATEGAVMLWNRETGQGRELLKRARSRSHHSLDFSPDGRWLAAAAPGPEASVWIWSMGKTDGPPVRHEISSPLSATFTADARFLMVGGGLGHLHVWSTAALREPPLSVAAHRDEVRAIAALPGTGRILTGSRDRTIRLWTPYSDNEGSFRWLARGSILRGTADGPGGSEAFSESGRFHAVTHRSEDGGRVTIRDLKQRSQPLTIAWSSTARTASSGGLKAESLDSGLVQLTQSDEPPGELMILDVPGSQVAPVVAFLPGSNVLLTMSKPSARFNTNRTIRLQVASTATLADEVCSRVRRNLTEEEWQQYVGPDIPYERTCANR